MENPQHIKQLYEKYLNNDFSERELDELLEYFYNSGEHHELSDLIRSELANEESEYKSHAAVQALLSDLDRDLFVEIEKHRIPVKSVRLWPRMAVTASRSKFGTSLIAAAAVAAVVFGVWFYNTSYMNDRHPDAGQDLALVHQDIAPGKNGATITLANGKVIQLSDAKSGVVVGNDKLAYNDGSSVGSRNEFGTGSRNSKGGGPDLYRSSTARANDVMLTASTAKGQTYQFILPDGTKVWLNADSKLEFPSNFVNSKTRNVKLSGEGYFEVSKDKAHPFLVQTEKQTVEVLGTHFNITAYADEPNTKTTLAEGRVKVNDAILRPNQQSILNHSPNENQSLKIIPVDAESEIAWKNGNFIFNDEDLQSILRKVARWYNVSIEYKEVPEGVSLLGAVSRTKNVSAVLKALEATGKVHFKIEGRRITVMR